jgi:bifunctional DNA-binding transcriptional regulator/antitoxin component of YhaV-PrlF toxin-antitoxin module
MATLTLTAKGQLTLRKELLAHLGIVPGDKITVEKHPNGRVELVAVQKTGKISDAFGMLHRAGRKAVSIEEMNEAIREGWAGEG